MGESKSGKNKWAFRLFYSLLSVPELRGVFFFFFWGNNFLEYLKGNWVSSRSNDIYKKILLNTKYSVIFLQSVKLLYYLIKSRAVYYLTSYPREIADEETVIDDGPLWNNWGTSPNKVEHLIVVLIQGNIFGCHIHLTDANVKSWSWPEVRGRDEGF